MIQGLPDPEKLPKDLRDLYLEAEATAQEAATAFADLKFKIDAWSAQETKCIHNLQQHEFDNALMPLQNLKDGFRPAVLPFEIRDGGPLDGKRIITLCIVLPGKKAVMPVLQVPDFDLLSQSVCASSHPFELILPADGEGKNWQSIISETVKEYEDKENE